MKRNGIYFDPALGKDRFDFNGESLTDEDVASNDEEREEPKGKGGEGSGNFGHSGRPGEIGGSGEGGSASNPFDAEGASPILYPITYAGHGATPKEERQLETWQSKLTEEQKLAVDDWQEFGFKEIRSSQISGESSPEMDTKISNFESALETAPVFSEPTYRGMKNLSSSNVQELANAKEITLEAHTSFTGSKHTAAGFSPLYDYGEGASTKPIKGVLFEVRGTATGKLIQTTEREVIIPKGKTFSVVSRNVIQYEKDRARVLHLVLEPK